jgi:hypothetical protein
LEISDLEWPYPEGLVSSALEKQERSSHAYSKCVQIAGERHQWHFSSENHRFYIGKMIAESDEDSPSDRPQKNIYSEECIAGLLAILFDNLKEGELAQLVICPQFSSWFNGDAETQYAHTPETQAELIYSIAKKKFGKDKRNLHVININQDPAHAALVERIKGSVGPSTDRCSVQAAFSGEIGDGNDSLTIATALFQAAQKSDAFRQALYATVPSRLKKKDAELTEDELLQAVGYTIAELGVRISDLLAGRELQGGIERQTRYDEIIKALFELSQDEPSGRFKRINVLKPIANRLRGKNFTGVYLNDEKNYFKHRPRQIAARIRLSIYGLLGLGALGGVYRLGGYEQRLIEEHREEYVDRCLEKADGLSKDPKERQKEFDHFLQEVEDELAHRYSVPNYNNDSTINAFVNEFCSRDLSWVSKKTPQIGIQDHVDDFVTNNGFIVMSSGGISGAPYSRLDQYKDDFREALKVTPETKKEWSSSNEGFGEHCIAEIIDTNGEEHLLWQDLYRHHTLTSEYVFTPAHPLLYSAEEPIRMSSTLEGKEVVKDLLATRERFEARRVTPYFNLSHWDFDTTSLPQDLIVDCDDSGTKCLNKTEYPGFLGPNFSLALYNSEGKSIPIAKKDGEDHYSYRTALEAWTRYADTLGYSMPH